jgi:hypothetical protein
MTTLFLYLAMACLVNAAALWACLSIWVIQSSNNLLRHLPATLFIISNVFESQLISSFLELFLFITISSCL